MGTYIAVAIVAAFLFGLLGRWVAYQCGRGRWEGFLLGFLFGPLGVLVELLLPKFPPTASELLKHHFDRQT